MPIYEYECVKCHQTTEALQKISDPPLTDCPHCHGRLRKLMSLNSFHLKGSGWYVTDYAGKKSGSHVDKSSGESGDAADTGKKTETSTSSSKSDAET